MERVLSSSWVPAAYVSGRPVPVFGSPPHAHMQAMRTRDDDFWHGAPVPIRFGGKFLVRNQVVRAGTGGNGG